MSEPTRFPNAPITEALLDIRVKLSEQIDLAQLATIQDLIKDQYPSRHERLFWQSDLQIAQGDLKISPPTGGPVGYAFTSLDGKQNIQARKDGFSFSRLKPYEDWISLRDEAKRLWQYYIQALVGFQGRGCVDGVQPNCGPPFLLETLLFPWPSIRWCASRAMVERKTLESNKSVSGYPSSSARRSASRHRSRGTTSS
jgi:hypothetical protein